MKKISFKKKEKTVKSKVVTQGNLEESRAEILAKGKKFKYTNIEKSFHAVSVALMILALKEIAFGKKLEKEGFIKFEDGIKNSKIPYLTFDEIKLEI